MMSVQTVQTGDEQCMLDNMESSPFESSTNYDIVCIGFGTRTLALATALADRDPTQRVLIMERRSHFNSNLASISPANVSGSVFLRDLITFQNPRSEYTFINFLHSKGLLVGFTNVSQMRPSQLLVGEYIAWVAGRTCQLGWTAFNAEATRIGSTRSSREGRSDRWTVEIRDSASGELSTVTSKRVVVATGSSSSPPDALNKPEVSPFLIPLRESARLLERMKIAEQPLEIALLGADQQTVELMEHLHAIPGQHRATMIFPGSALRVEDGTPL